MHVAGGRVNEAWTDVFGVRVENGDVIMSSSTSGGMVKLGTADEQPGDAARMMRVTMAARWGHHVPKPAKRSAVGYNVVVLRKCNGAVPGHFAGLVQVAPVASYNELPGMWDESDLIGGETDD